MANDDMQNEIESLRAQVAEMTAERKAKENERPQANSRQAPTTESAPRDAGATESSEEQAGSTKTGAADLTSQFQELIDTIDEELKAASPVTVLVVFALGVLVGRLLPR